MLNPKSIRFAVAAFALFAPSAFADSWIEQQLAVTDGYTQRYELAGAQGRRDESKPDAQSSWIEQQRSISDVYSAGSANRVNVYRGASPSFDSNESFVQHAIRVSDGTPE